jgi:hypothetical protein
MAVPEAKGKEFERLLFTVTETKKGNMAAHQARHIQEYTKFCQICTFLIAFST